MKLDHDTPYLVNRSSAEYPIRVMARWVRKADHLPRFHYFRTTEGEEICAHVNAVTLANPKPK